MKNLIIYISLFLLTQASFGQCPLNRLVNEINSNTQLKNAIKNNPDLIDSWKKLDDLGADDVLKNDPEVLKYISNGRSNEILLEVEEILGGHSIERHGAHLPLPEMRQRVIGQHPTMPQSRSALKFDSNSIHQSSVNEAFRTHKTDIENHFSQGGGYKEWSFNLNNRIGNGYHNAGTVNNPSAVYVTTDKIKITFAPDSNSPSGYIMISAYPWYTP